jgi:4-hydroxy-tetrahydrodipicolinate synthase
MPAFGPNEALDLASTCRWVDSLIDRGIRLFWTTYGTSHFMTLSDEELMELTRAVAAVTRGRATFIASTAFHWSTQRCIEFTQFAAECGVDIVKLQVDWRWLPSEDLVFEHYRKIAEASPLPLFAYTLAQPGLTGGMSVRLLERILELPQFVGFKNDTGDFYEQTAYLAAIRKGGRPFAAMTGGSMESFLHGHEFGATAFAAALGMIAPELTLRFADHLDKGEREAALQIVREIEQPTSRLFGSFYYLSHWAAYHTVLHLRGHFKSDQLRFPLRTLGPEAASQIRAHLETPGILQSLIPRPR